MEAELHNLSVLLKAEEISEKEFEARKASIKTAYSFASDEEAFFNVIKVLGQRPLPEISAQRDAVAKIADTLGAKVGFALRDKIIENDSLLNILVTYATESCEKYNNETSVDFDVFETLMRGLYSLAGRNQLVDIRDDKLIGKLHASGLSDKVIIEKYPFNKSDLGTVSKRTASCFALGIVQEISAVIPEAAVTAINSSRFVEYMEALQAFSLAQLKELNEAPEPENEEESKEGEAKLEALQLLLVMLWKFLSVALKVVDTTQGTKAVNAQNLERVFKMVSLMTFDPSETKAEDSCCDENGNCSNEGACEKDCCADEEKLSCCDENGNCSNEGACEKDCCAEGEEADDCCAKGECGDAACCDDPDSCNACGPTEEAEDDCCAEEAEIDQFDINASAFYAKLAMDSNFVNSDIWSTYKNPQTGRTLPFDLGQLAGKLLSSVPDDRVITNCLVALLCLTKSTNEAVKAEATEVIEILTNEESGVLDVSDLEDVKKATHLDAISIKYSSGFEIPTGEEDETVGDDDDMDDITDDKGNAREGLAVAPACKRAIANNQCTFSQTKLKFSAQYFFECADCNMAKGEGICVVCAEVCHKGHKLSKKRHGMKFYCDCGGSHSEKCKALVQ